MRIKQNQYIISLGGGENQIPLIRAIQRSGYKVYTIDWNENCTGFLYSSAYLVESVYNYEQIYLETKKAIPDSEIKAIGCRSFHHAVITQSYLQTKYKKSGISFREIHKFYDKNKLKQILLKNQLTLPKMYNSGNVQFPCIFKAKDGDSKKDIFILSNQEELDSKLLETSNPEKYLLEEYIKGDEITILGLVLKKRFHLISMTDKITTQYPPFLEIAHIAPSKYDLISKKVQKTCQAIVDALKMENCPFVCEFKIDSNQNLYLIEVKPEIGGEYLADYLVPIHYGYNYFDNYVNLLLGKTIQKVPIPIPNQTTCIVFLVPPKGNSIYLSSKEIELDNSEIQFLEKDLQSFGSKLDISHGNSSRVKVVGIQKRAESLMNQNYYMEIIERLESKFGQN